MLELYIYLVASLGLQCPPLPWRWAVVVFPDKPSTPLDQLPTGPRDQREFRMCKLWPRKEQSPACVFVTTVHRTDHRVDKEIPKGGICCK